MATKKKKRGHGARREGRDTEHHGSDADASLRVAAAEALGGLACPASTAALQEGLRHADASTRAAAASALGKLGEHATPAVTGDQCVSTYE